MQLTQTTPALSCEATCSATLMLSLQTQAARPYTVLFASSTASLGVRNVIAASTGPKISCCATIDVGCTLLSKRRRIVKAARGQLDLRLPAGRAFRDSLVDQPLDAVELHPRDDRANVDRLVERRPDAQRAHAIANLCDERLGDALLHQQARAGAADLSLIEPDAVDQAFDRAVEIGVFEDDERRLAAQLEREPLVAGRSGAADGASHFGRAGERDLVDVGMLDQRFAGRAVAGDDVDDARRQSDFLSRSRRRQAR